MPSLTLVGEQQRHVGTKRNRVPSPEILWRIATNVIRLRKARGYSQIELAARIGVTNSWISKVEREKKNLGIASLEAIAQGLDCGVEDLVMKPPFQQSVEPELDRDFPGPLRNNLQKRTAPPGNKELSLRSRTRI